MSVILEAKILDSIKSIESRELHIVSMEGLREKTFIIPLIKSIEETNKYATLRYVKTLKLIYEKYGYEIEEKSYGGIFSDLKNIEPSPNQVPILKIIYKEGDPDYVVFPNVKTKYEFLKSFKKESEDFYLNYKDYVASH